MTRNWLAIVAATACTAVAFPAAAQQVAPPLRAPPLPAWTDPQPGPYPPVMPQPPYAAPIAVPDGPAYAGAYMPPPPVPPVAYPLAAGAYGASYAAGGAYAAGQCGCGGGYTVNWVEVPIQTHYTYSAPIELVHEIPTERVVYQQVTERTRAPVRRAAKYVKTARPTKMTKGKALRTK